MAERQTKAHRIRLQLAAERELQRYTDNAMWVKHVLGIDLDPLQILRMETLDKQKMTVAWDARRMRKTTSTFLHALKCLATRTHEELCAITPRQEQANKAMDEYMLTSIRKEDGILYSYLDYKGGRRQLNDTGFSFANQSKAWTAGIMGEVDGSGITYAIMDELEDMDYDRLTTRFLPMLGQAEKLGAGRKAEPQVRALGVIKGSGIRKEFLSRGFYPMTQADPKGPIIGDVYLGLEMGILNREWIEMQRGLMSPDDWRRQMLCMEVESTNVIHYKWARRAMTLGKKVGDGGLVGQIAEPLPGQEYRRHGMIALGYDHLGHGENAKSSRSALVIAELVGEHVVFPFVKSWEPWADETRVMEDLIFVWRYFRPDIAYGDALGVGMITETNDRLYKLGLTNIDRLTIGDGASSASTWPEWAFSPLRFHGEQKHKMAQALRLIFQRGRAVVPWFDDNCLPDEGVEREFKRFIDQICNVEAVPAKTGGAYPSYKIDDKTVGDDYFDAAMAAVWALWTRSMPVQTEIGTLTKSRQQLLGAA